MAKAIINVDIDLNSAPIADLEQELESVNDQLKKVDQNSEAFKELSARAGEVTNQLNKANKAAEGFTDEKKFMAADGAIKVMGGSLSGVVGTLGLIGVESEAFGEMEKKAASAIAVAMGVKDISEGYKQLKESTLLASTASKFFGTTTKKALVATGIGIFAVALGTIIAYWDDIVKGVENFAKKVPFVGQALDTIKRGFDNLVDAFRPVLEFLGLLPDAAERAEQAIVKNSEEAIKKLEREIAIAQASGKAAEDLFKLKKELIEEELKLLETSGAEEADIYAKNTELLVLKAEERKRLMDEAEGKAPIGEQITSVNALGEANLKLVSTLDSVSQANMLVGTTMTENDKKLTGINREDAKAILLQQGREEALYATADATMALGDVIGQQTVAGKALASSTALINTYLGISEILKQESTLPSPFDFIVKIANVATVLSTGLAAVKNINATPVSTTGTASSGGGGIPGGGGGPRIPAIPTTQDVGAPETSSVQPTVRAYVVTGDVNTAQEADARLNRRRSLG